MKAPTGEETGRVRMPTRREDRTRADTHRQADQTVVKAPSGEESTS